MQTSSVNGATTSSILTCEEGVGSGGGVFSERRVDLSSVLDTERILKKRLEELTSNDLRIRYDAHRLMFDVMASEAARDRPETGTRIVEFIFGLINNTELQMGMRYDAYQLLRSVACSPREIDQGVVGAIIRGLIVLMPTENIELSELACECIFNLARRGDASSEVFFEALNFMHGDGMKYLGDYSGKIAVFCRELRVLVKEEDELGNALTSFWSEDEEESACAMSYIGDVIFDKGFDTVCVEDEILPVVLDALECDEAYMRECGIELAEMIYESSGRELSQWAIGEVIRVILDSYSREYGGVEGGRVLSFISRRVEQLEDRSTELYTEAKGWLESISSQAKEDSARKFH